MCILCHGHQTFLKILNFDHSVVNQEKESSRERAFIQGKDNETIQVEGKTIGHQDEEANDSDMSKYGHDHCFGLNFQSKKAGFRAKNDQNQQKCHSNITTDI